MIFFRIRYSQQGITNPVFITIQEDEDGKEAVSGGVSSPVIVLVF